MAMQTQVNYSCMTNTLLHCFKRNVEHLNTNFEVTFESSHIWNGGSCVFLSLVCKDNSLEISALHGFCVRSKEDFQRLRTFCERFEDDALNHMETCSKHECTDL